MTDGDVDSTCILKFGEYRLMEELGESAQFRVYKARHTKLQRDAVVKVLREEFAGDREALARFRREMEAVGGVEHPHVVWATDAGEHNGTPYIVMEYLPGRTLQQIVAERGPLRVADACEVVRQAARGLECIHGRGMVHRDVKPSNLLLTEGGIVKLLDFGLVRMTEGASAGEELTATASAVGTADYMAPEQASDSRSVDARADLYSLGCTLYELLTGRPPFAEAAHDTAVKKLLAHSQALPPDPRAVRPEVPHELSGFVRRLLAKLASERPARADEVIRQLALFTAGNDLTSLVAPAVRTARPSVEPPRATTPPADRIQPALPRRRGRRLAALAVLLGLPVAMYAAWQGVSGALSSKTVSNDGQPGSVPAVAGSGTPAEPPAPPATESAPASPPSPAQELDDLQQLVAGAADLPETEAAALRQRLGAFALRSAGTPRQVPVARLMAQLPSPADALQQAAIPDEERTAHGREADATLPPELVQVFGSSRLRHWRSVRAIAFSPDGSMLATPSADGTVRVWDSQTGEPIARMQSNAPGYEAAGFSADGSVLFALGPGGRVLKWNTTTWQPLRDGGQQSVGPLWTPWDSAWVTFSRDGRLLIAAGQENSVLVYEVDAGRLRHTLAGLTAAAKCVAVSGDNGLVAAGDESGTVIVWDAASGAPREKLEPGHGPVWSVALHPQGTLVVAGHEDGSIALKSVGDASDPRFVQVPGSAGALDLSPDGRRLLVGSGGSGTGVRELDVETGATLRVLDPSSSWSHFPRYSPDGASIACGYWDSDVGLWDASTGKRRFEPNGHHTAAWSVAASADGALIASGGRDGNVVVWNVATGEIVRKSNFGAWPKVLAFVREPDRLYVALNSGNDGTRIVGFWHARTGRRQSMLRVPGQTWSLPGTIPSADGAIVVSVDERNDISVWETNGRERVILPNHGAAVEVMAVSADGRWIASAERNERIRIWDATTGEELRTLLTPGYVGTALAFSPDGTRLACGASDCDVRVWDTQSWDDPVRLKAHEPSRFGVTGIVFSPDGALLASCSADGAVQVWSAPSLTPRASIQFGPRTALINALTFLPDSRHIATANQNGTVSLLRLKPE